MTHLFAMVSDGGVHSHIDHVIALAKRLNAERRPVLIHIITDGRDTAPHCALEQLAPLEKAVDSFDSVRVASMVGRFYAMDRDNRTERMAVAIDLYEKGVGAACDGIASAVALSYENDARGDEFSQPTRFPDFQEVSDGDVLLFANFRADRMRQLVAHFIEACPQSHISTLTEYDASFSVNVLFPTEAPCHTLGEIIQRAGGRQLRIAESEKYAHVTFFLNGGREEPFENEARIVVPSPKVATYDLAPEMALEAVTEKLVDAIVSGAFDFICLNIANGDQVGHSGSLEASVQAMMCIDAALARITKALDDVAGEMVLIADHGNCEEMLLDDGSISVAHSMNPVPFVYRGRNAVLRDGTLADVAPTLLHILGLPQPKEMTGKNRLKFT